MFLLPIGAFSFAVGGLSLAALQELDEAIRGIRREETPPSYQIGK